MIRQCKASDFAGLLEVINDAARAYKGVIPADRWHEPYMSQKALQQEIADGVMFWGWESHGQLLGVMGIQDKPNVTLIRHAYVRTCAQGQGIGKRLLQHLQRMTRKPILIGTWADAHWAIAFYRKNGYGLVSEREKKHLLRTYWSIPKRQVETSVVLARGIGA